MGSVASSQACCRFRSFVPSWRSCEFSFAPLQTLLIVTVVSITCCVIAPHCSDEHHFNCCTAETWSDFESCRKPEGFQALAPAHLNMSYEHQKDEQQGRLSQDITLGVSPPIVVDPATMANGPEEKVSTEPDSANADSLQFLKVDVFNL